MSKTATRGMETTIWIGECEDCIIMEILEGKCEIQVHEYTDGKKSREQAIADIKKLVADNLGIIAE